MNGSLSISIALPVHNGANYLREALDSICAQTFSDFELVISDNVSTDETPRICQEYAHRDGRIKVSRSEALLGQADNVNRAVSLTSGEWVKLFCHDDLMAPDCMAAIGLAASGCTPRTGLIGNGEQWLFANGYRHSHLVNIPDGLQHWEGREFLRERLAGRQVPPLASLTTATLRKRAWLEAGGFESRFVHFDIFLWTQMLMNWDYLYIPEVLTVNRIHGAQVAVSARKSLKSVTDNQVFWPEFVRINGNALGLSRWERLAVSHRGMGAAGAAVAVQLLRGDFILAVATFIHLPLRWWPWLPVFVMRSYRSERRKLADLVPHVPVSTIYPG